MRLLYLYGDKCYLAAQLQLVSGHSRLDEAAVVNTTEKNYKLLTRECITESK